MTPVYLNPPPSPFSLAEEKEDQHLKLLFNSGPYQTPSSNSLSAPTFFNSLQDHQDQSGTTVEESQERDQKADKPIWKEAAVSSSYYNKVCFSSSTSVQPVVANDAMSNGQSEDQDEDDSKSKNGSVKWMSSKMRLMQKMMNPPDHIPAATVDKRERNNNTTQFNFSFNANNTVRVCSDCNTTTTPLWRSGPRGPKSLCNACGIRQRKARRAMSEAAAAANGFLIATDTSSSSMSVKNIKVHNKEKKSRAGHVAQYKNKCKLVDSSVTTTSSTTASISSQRKLCCFNDFGFGRGVFPQDVAEAAILLMELSCGFIHS